MKSAKPIFIVKIPSVYTQEQGDSIRAHFKESSADLREDYHIMMIDGQPITEIAFECFNVSDVDEVKFEEFKKVINESK